PRLTAIDLGDRHTSELPGPCGIPVPLDPHHQPARTAGSQIVNATTRDQPAVVDDRHRLAQILDQVELMAGEHDTTPGGCTLDENSADVIDPGWVEPRQRLVEHDQLGIVHKS